MTAGTLWVEKYRPTQLAEVVGQEHAIPRLRRMVEMQQVPHLLFAGRQGTGKTAAAVALASELFGAEAPLYFKEMNASDEGRIQFIRTEVKSFASTRAFGDFPYKIIFLDECDHISRDAQWSLRRLMERHVSSCRFIFSCNFFSLANHGTHTVKTPIRSRDYARVLTHPVQP